MKQPYDHMPQSIFGTLQRREFGAFLEHDRNRADATPLTRKVNATTIKKILKDQLLSPYSRFTHPEHGAGVQISFAEFMATRPDGGDVLLSDRTDKPLTWADLFHAMKADPSKLLLNELADMNDFRGLVGVLISDSFIKGYSETSTGRPPLWSQMCFATGIDTKFDEVRKTWFTFQGEPTKTGEAEQFPEATIRSGNETIRLEKRGLTLRLTAEFIRENPLTIIEGWLTEMGRVYQAIENDRAVETLLNGDVPSGANAAPVIGVGDTTIGIDFADFTRCWNRGYVIGENWATFVAGEDMSQKIASIDEFKEPRTGKSQVVLQNKPEPSVMNRFVSPKMPSSQVLLVDWSHALRQRVFIPLRIDRSFKPEDWTEGVTLGYVTGFERVADKACLVIDESLAFADHGFPEWFTVGGSRPY